MYFRSIARGGKKQNKKKQKLTGAYILSFDIFTGSGTRISEKFTVDLNRAVSHWTASEKQNANDGSIAGNNPGIHAVNLLTTNTNSRRFR